VLIYIHKEKELDDIERRYPAEHYVLVDDKPRILTVVKKVWGDRVTTVFPASRSVCLRRKGCRRMSACGPDGKAHRRSA
jgi:hypothetical protein